MSCKFAGQAESSDSFWTALESGSDCLSEVPLERWRSADFFDPNPKAPGKLYTKEAGFLSRSIKTFDAAFFGISPKEAELVDPQQRLLMETTHEALEAAGLTPNKLEKSNTGVFIGSTTHEFADFLATLPKEKTSSSHFGTGTSLAALSGRISYLFGLQGPCLTIDTACSSSLVAIDAAREKILGGKCNMAIVGGVNAIIDPNFTVKLCKAKMLSPTSRCHSFDADADGYARGEGCGVVILKRLSDAQRDGDPILALIRGSAVNQDGASGGLTVPNGPAQVKVCQHRIHYLIDIDRYVM